MEEGRREKQKCFALSDTNPALKSIFFFWLCVASIYVYMYDDPVSSQYIDLAMQIVLAMKSRGEISNYSVWTNLETLLAHIRGIHNEVMRDGRYAATDSRADEVMLGIIICSS